MRATRKGEDKMKTKVKVTAETLRYLQDWTLDTASGAPDEFELEVDLEYAEDRVAEHLEEVIGYSAPYAFSVEGPAYGEATHHVIEDR